MTEFSNDKFLRKINISELSGLPKISSFLTVRALNGVESDVFTDVPLVGKSLKYLGIFSGDLLIVKVTKHFHEANLCVWNTPDGKMAKFAEMSCAEITPHNGDGWRKTYTRSDVSILGVVVRIERDLKIGR